MRVRGLIEYLGTGWAGWQAQDGVPTIQCEIEKAIRIATGIELRIAVAGRTDAGVHAHGQVIAFDVPDDTDLFRLRGSLNGLTADSICVVTLERAGDAFDPRKDAVSRTYRYTIVHGRPRSPFLDDRAWTLYAPLPVERLLELAPMVIGERDFHAFRASDCESRSTFRNVLDSRWESDGTSVLTYTVTANAFLKQMVRTLVGTMVDVALDRVTKETFALLLSGRGTRQDAGRTAPARGLTLLRVDYPADALRSPIR
ncbi:MAG TPA: tRNA pseudouridine(38-40) synthase TruA [Candidatus Limnocylindrales bacterium]|nr:tRNA pseudouridine(38-40) synthase TruA [Candidatus Limnocylindrales bacterium]